MINNRYLIFFLLIAPVSAMDFDNINSHLHPASSPAPPVIECQTKQGCSEFFSPEKERFNSAEYLSTLQSGKSLLLPSLMANPVSMMVKMALVKD